MAATVSISIPEWLDKICVWPLMLYRRLKYGQPYRKIYLGEGAYTIVDPQDYYTFGKYKWVLLGTKYNLYAVREAKIGLKETKRVYLHREIMKPRKGKLVDHRNTISLDNRRANLRIATHAQNNYNRRKTAKKTASRFVGVSFDKYSPAWVSCISYKRKRINLGRFKNEIDAARAYDMAALKYHKRFARLNFPREDYVRTRNGYKFAGQSRPDKKNCLPGTKLSKIYSSILSRFGEQKKMKGRVEL